MMSRFTTTHPGRTFFARACMLTAVCAPAAGASAQETTVAAAPDTTVAAKQDTTSPEAIYRAQVFVAPRPGRLARTFTWAKAKMDRPSTGRGGFYPELSGMIPGAGFSAGAGYRHALADTGAVINTSAAVSWRRYVMMQSEVAWPELLAGRLSAGGQVRYQDFKRINFFGIGSMASKANQTDYRLTNVDALGFATVRAGRSLSITGRAGLLRRVNVGDGSGERHPSTGVPFDEIPAPNLAGQPHYVHADVALDVDTRDVPGHPAKGGRYHVALVMFHDEEFARFSFRRVEAEAAQYISLGPTVLAMRGRLDLSQTAEGQTVPFYLLPTLGGSTSLRGFSDYRFRDRGALLLGAEYSVPVSHMVDAAVFYDAGAVGPQAQGLTHHMNRDYGAGVRVHSATKMLARLDVARSREGTRLLLTFSAPLAPPSRNVAPYVP